MEVGTDMRGEGTPQAPLDVPTMREWWYSDGSAHHVRSDGPVPDYKHRGIPFRVRARDPNVQVCGGIPEPDTAFEKSLSDSLPPCRISYMRTLARPDRTRVSIPPNFDPDEDDYQTHPTRHDILMRDPGSVFRNDDDERNRVLRDIDSHLAELRAKALELNAVKEDQSAQLLRKAKRKARRRVPTMDDIAAQRRALIEMAFDEGRRKATGDPALNSRPSIGSLGRQPHMDPIRVDRHVGSFKALHRNSGGFSRPGHFVDIGPPPAALHELVYEEEEDKEELNTAGAVIDALPFGDMPVQRTVDVALKHVDEREALEATSIALNQLRSEESRLGRTMRMLELSRQRRPDGQWYERAAAGEPFADEYSRCRAYDALAAPRSTQAREEYVGLMKTLGTLDLSE